MPWWPQRVIFICATACSSLCTTCKTACRSLRRILVDILSAPFHILILAKSQLNGGHTEYFVVCGLGVPSLRSLWGAIRNRQLYILHTYCKGGGKRVLAFAGKKDYTNFLHALHFSWPNCPAGAVCRGGGRGTSARCLLASAKCNPPIRLENAALGVGSVSFDALGIRE